MFFKSLNIEKYFYNLFYTGKSLILSVFEIILSTLLIITGAENRMFNYKCISPNIIIKLTLKRKKKCLSLSFSTKYNIIHII